LEAYLEEFLENLFKNAKFKVSGHLFKNLVYIRFLENVLEGVAWFKVLVTRSSPALEADPNSPGEGRGS